MSRFVKPLVARLKISQGDHVDVKKRLNTGEQQDYLARCIPHIVPGEKRQLESREVMRAKVLAYLVGWSLMDEGKPVPYSLDMSEADRLSVLNSLDPETFHEISEAIDAHEEAEEQAREAAKNVQDGVSESSALSPSLGPMAGVTNG